MSATILFSRFPDTLTPGAEPLVLAPELVTIHPHQLAPGRRLVFTWRWDDGARDYVQTAVVETPAEEARGYVPEGAQRRPVPAEFGLEAWVVA